MIYLFSYFSFCPLGVRISRKENPNKKFRIEKNMFFKPDYGFRLLNEGLRPGCEHVFYNFPLYNLSIIGPGQFSTFAEIPIDGVLHALSIDFSTSELKTIFSIAGTNKAFPITSEFFKDPITPRTIELSGNIVVGVKAILGNPQKSEKESFVPLIAIEIF